MCARCCQCYRCRGCCHCCHCRAGSGATHDLGGGHGRLTRVVASRVPGVTAPARGGAGEPSPTCVWSWRCRGGQRIAQRLLLGGAWRRWRCPGLAAGGRERSTEAPAAGTGVHEPDAASTASRCPCATCQQLEHMTSTNAEHQRVRACREKQRRVAGGGETREPGGGAYQNRKRNGARRGLVTQRSHNNRAVQRSDDSRTVRAPVLHRSNPLSSSKHPPAARCVGDMRDRRR